MKKCIYMFFLRFVRPMLHSFGFDFVAWHKEICHADIWKEVLKYSDIAKSFIPDDSSRRDKARIIWQFWWQGLDACPPIVKSCMESVRKHASGFAVIVIDHVNYSNYLDIPQCILERFNAGKMSIAHFSDYVRTCLLAKYGGIWADATVYLTDDIPNEIICSDFFMFKSALWAHDEEIPDITLLEKSTYVAGRKIMGGGADAGSSWFLSARSGSPVFSLTAKLLEAYWNQHEDLIDYYLFHKFLSLCVCLNKSCKAEYCSAPSKTNISPHLLQFSLLDDADEILWNAIRRVSSVHKLTYKLAADPRFISLGVV